MRNLKNDKNVNRNFNIQLIGYLLISFCVGIGMILSPHNPITGDTVLVAFLEFIWGRFTGVMIVFTSACFLYKELVANKQDEKKLNHTNCQQCQSSDLSKDNSSVLRIISVILLFPIGLVFLFTHKNYRCNQCNYKFKL